MKKELEETLIKAYPNLYVSAIDPSSKSLMRFGFSYGDGWFLLTEALSAKLEAMILALPEEERGKYKASQCKEKFGMLRWYMSAETDEMTQAINEAEEQSAKTCERCGRPGTIVPSGGWFRCQCDVCLLLK